MAESKKVTATLVIDFAKRETEESSGVLVLEIDDREDGLNKGETSFRPGDSPGYLLYRAENVRLDLHDSTVGAIASAGSGNRTIEEYLVFSDSREASLRYPAAAGISTSWIGKSGGKVSLQDQNTIVIPENIFAVLKVTYAASYTAHRLTNVPENVTKVLIFATGTIND